MKRILLIALFSIVALNLANAQGKSQENKMPRKSGKNRKK